MKKCSLIVVFFANWEKNADTQIAQKFGFGFGFGFGFNIYLFSDIQTHKGIHYISEITGGFK